MVLDYEDENLRKLAHDARFDMGFDRAVVKAYRMRIQFIDAAVDERAFYQMASWRFEKLKGDLAGKYSIRLNLQWRLLVELRPSNAGKIVVVVSICDYH